MEKILKKYTTIPQHLYVNRSADKQLIQIVNEMQRPGYVLVARQMGKTNLLFNAKRTLENKNRLFVYVDLSNVFKYELDCYRNIIDSVIEPNESLFESIEGEIEKIRSKKLPPHKEYSRCLRVILDFFGGDIVIILDEIDALRTAEYSDNIFAQIRSNYFSRTNFPVFEKLTYILSGVIEPSELIKDRNKSPFNIGDKIYLDDFTFEEHKSFIIKSKLKISEEISEEIFNWTNGNPRLTFDICSEVESIILNEKKISIDDIEPLIKTKYLISYDIAPIDHIRELVKSNKKVRDAVLKIQQKKSENLSDEIKKKLYLYGIINSSFDKESFVKNPIVSKCISEEWIKSIDKQTQDNLGYGLDKIDQLDYDEAIIALTEFAENSNPSRDKLEICNYNLGYAFYSKNNLEKAIEFFKKEFLLDSFKDNAKAFLGISQIGLGEIETGVPILEEIVSEKSNNYAYRNALMNLAKYTSTVDQDKAIILYTELIESTFNSNDTTKEDELNKLRVLSYYHQSEIFYSKKQNEKVITVLNSALEYSNISDSLFLKYNIYNTLSDKDSTIINEISSTIIDNEITFNFKEQYPFSFNENHLSHYLDSVFDIKNLDVYHSLLNYSENKLHNNKYSKSQIVLWASRITDNGKALLKDFLKIDNNISNKDLLYIYRSLSSSYTNEFDIYFNYFNKFKSIFVNENELNSDDIYLFAIAIKHLSDKSEINKALELCNIINQNYSNIEDEELKFEYVIIYYWYSSLYFSLKKREKAIEYANIAINIVDKSKNKRTSIIDEKGLKSIYEQLVQIKTASINQKPIVKTKKYGRNDRVKVKYKDGNIQENKYKKLEADILAERCVII
ncbi:MAG: AAA-like domain-containing protein [Flavobacteriaceae bacterium]|nr:AAA-like domain-containing protein [Flavobacteriaceae bacterium]